MRNLFEFNSPQLAAGRFIFGNGVEFPFAAGEKDFPNFPGLFAIACADPAANAAIDEIIACKVCVAEKAFCSADPIFGESFVAPPAEVIAILDIFSAVFLALWVTGPATAGNFDCWKRVCRNTS
jgi:hypothetical protein